MNHHDEEFLAKAAAAKAKVKQVAPDQVDSDAEGGSIVIDVREPEEYEVSQVSGAINISLSTITEEIQKVIPDKSTPIICYCNGGNRGSLAAVELQELGYTNVSSIEGGLKAYQSLTQESDQP